MFPYKYLLFDNPQFLRKIPKNFILGFDPFYPIKVFTPHEIKKPLFPKKIPKKFQSRH